MEASKDFDADLNISPLGTHEHWEDSYQVELKNFEETGDEGEIWFGQASAKRMVQYLAGLKNLAKDDPVIDLGCGNGMLLVDMWKAGFTNLHGVDYADNAILLAKSVCQYRGCPAELQVGNIVEWSGPDDAYRIALDKGTYDAISLNPDNAREKMRGYCESVRRLLKPGGVLVITSCNWTEQELISQFQQYLKYVVTLPSLTFTFGGSSGSKVVTVAFEKLPNSETS